MNTYQQYFPPKLVLYEDKMIVYLVQLNLFKTAEFIPFLSPDEQIRADKLKDKHKQKQFIVTRGILRNLLSSCLVTTKPEAIYFVYAKHGKPGINNTFFNKQIKFNLSHSSDYALFAFTLEHEIGVDIERMDPHIKYRSFGNRFFSQQEIEQLEKYDETQRLAAFYRCWTRKEAFIKAEGSGLALGLKKFSVSLDKITNGECSLLDKPIHLKEKWFNYETIELPHYKTAIIANKSDLHLVTHVIQN